MNAHASIDVSDVVCASLAEICKTQGLFDGQILPELSIVDDLGFDSLLFVDLTVLLEERTALSDLQLLDWADRESMQRARRYTVRSLIEEVENCLAAAAARPRP